MAKVYILQWPYGDGIVGVYTTKEAAHAKSIEMCAEKDLDIEEFELETE